MLGAVTVSAASLSTLIDAMALKYNVPAALIKAIIKVESNWNINASRFEAHKTDASWGLMQVMLATAKETLSNSGLTITQLTNPSVNIEAGTKYLAQQLKRYNGNIMDAIAAYNAGSARKNESGVYNNNAYVQSVYGNYIMYQTLDTVSTPAGIGIGFAALAAIGLVMVGRN